MARQLGEAVQAAAFPSIAAAESQLVGGQSFVLVVGPSFSSPSGMSELGLFTRERRGTPVVMAAELLTTDLLQRAMRAGIGEVVVLSEDPTPLRQAVDQAAAFPSIAAADPRVEDGPILVVGPSFSRPHRMTELGLFTRERPGTPVVMVAEALTIDLLQQAMRAGIRDVVALSESSVPLRHSVEPTRDRKGPVVSQGPVAGEPAERSTGRGRIIAVFSAKGGAGKSFVATNLAAVLAGRNEKPVVLVDADLQFGDVAVMLGIEPHHTIVEAVDAIDRLDQTLLMSLLVEHEESGLYVLPAPLEPAFADAVGLPHIRRILDVLTTFCSHVVIDTPTSFDDIVLGVLEQADDIVLLAGMDIPHIKNTKIALQTLRLLQVPSDKIKLTLNRADSKVKLDIPDVERTLQIKADCLLPSDIAVPQSINEGVPIVIDAPRTGVSRNLERLADLFPAWTTEPTGRA